MSMEIVNKLNSLQGNATFDTVSEMLFAIDDSITIKKFKDNDELFLVHNDYMNNNDSTLYRECRSFVMAIKDGNAKIVSYSHESITEGIPEGEVEMQEAFEGTMITMFYYDRWRFVTSRCTDIDKSFFYNSKVTFGTMLDDCLRNMNTDRVLFANQLGDTNHMYSFVLVHHRNKYIRDYTDRFGENYAKLVLVGERENDTLIPCTPSTILDVIVPQTVTDNDHDCIICKVYDNERNTYRYYKKLSESYQIAMKRKPNFSNVWYSYFQIFLNNDKEHTIDMYMKENNIDDNYMMDENKINVTGMIYLLYKESATTLLDLVTHFTQFNGDTFTKINCDDYEKMNNHVYNNVKKQIATLQNLYRIGTIYNSNGVLNHLRKHVPVYQFVQILKGIYALRNQEFFEIKDKYYEKYLQFLINELNS